MEGNLQTSTTTSLEARTIAKVSVRFLPLLIICYFVAYLDRVNVSFAALTMRADLGLSETAYGFGAGIFFIAYFLFEVPSNMMLVRFGARKWIARIMFSWGIFSGAMAFVNSEISFYVVRVLLGVAEAGFFPGIIFFLTLWFPSNYRARIVGYFMAAVPFAAVVGAPVSGMLLGLDDFWGVQGWQWLFIIESVPALILSVVVFFYLTDKPADTIWLNEDERAWLINCLEQEQKQLVAFNKNNLLQVLLNPKVLLLSGVYFGLVTANYGFTFFLPQIVQEFGISNLKIGMVSALPYAVGTISMVLWGKRSDRKHERRFHLAFPLLMISIGMVISTIFDDPLIKMLAFSIAAFGIFSSMSVFWTFPTAFLSGASAAVGIALINSLGNLAGFVGPYVMGWIKDLTGSYTGGLLLLALASVIAMIIVLMFKYEQSPKSALPT